MSFFSFKPKSSLSFIFDIRDASVSCAAVRFQKNKKPEILVCRNFQIENSDVSDPEKHLAALVKSIDTAVAAVTKALIAISHTEKVEKYLFFIGSPWSVSSTKIIHVVKDVPFVVNDEFLQKIVTLEETTLAKEMEQKLGGKNWLVLEEKIIQSKLNGYAVEKIFERKASALEVELFVSFVPYEIKDTLASFVNQKNGARALRHSNSSLLASYLYLKDFYPLKNNFLYIDIGELITDAYIVRDGTVQGIVSIPIGQKDILKNALATSDLSEEIFVSQIAMKREGHSDIISEKDLGLLESSMKLWTEKLNMALGKIFTEINMPKTLLALSENSFTGFFLETLAKHFSDGSLKILGADMQVEIINESLASSEILNAKNFPYESHIKMDILFVQKIVH